MWINKKKLIDCIDIVCEAEFKIGQEYEKQEILKYIKDIKTGIETSRKNNCLLRNEYIDGFETALFFIEKYIKI